MANTVRDHKLQVPLWTRASDVKSLAECSLAWLLDYLRQGEYPDRGYFLVGEAVHQAIHYALVEDLGLIPEDIAGDARRYFVDLWTEADEVTWGTGKNARSLDTALADIDDMISNWHEAITTWPWYQEHELVASEKVVTFHDPDITDYPVSTTIDSLWVDMDGQVTINDWKTGVTPKADVRQLWVYYFAARMAKVIPLDMPFDGRFHHLWANKFQRVTEYPGDLFVINMLREVEDRKMSKTFYPKPDYYCSRCPHKNVCPAFGTVMDIDAILSKVEWQEKPIERK